MGEEEGVGEKRGGDED